MAKRYVCPACNKLCKRDVTHVCEYACSDCMSVPPCSDTENGVRYPCDKCNRHFRSQSCFAKHKIKMHGKRNKTVCEGKRRCGTCRGLITRENHECFKPFCANCNQNSEIGHLSFMQPLKNVLPRSDILFVFYDFATTQEERYSDVATQHVPNLVWVQAVLFAMRDAAR